MKQAIFYALMFGMIFGPGTGLAAGYTQARVQGRPPVRQVIYTRAKAGDVRALKALQARGISLEARDDKGNTALCEATWRKDRVAFQALRSAGANLGAACMNRIPASYKTAMGLSPATGTGAGTTGAGLAAATTAETAGLSTAAMVGIGVGAVALVGGGVALAAGGGGGSSSKGDKPQDTGGETCAGYTLTTCPANGDCDTCTDGDGNTRYTLTKCLAGYDRTGNTCVAHNCAAEGYQATACTANETQTGTCRSGASTWYKCQAKPVDKCENVNCGAHGMCSDGMCICSDNYYGPRCETAPLNCGSHGTWNPATKACDCSDGYTGATCQTAPVVDKCENVNCGAHGTCSEGMCVCSDNYYGPRCETAPLNCGSHGTWNPATKACDCSDGYTGTTCQTAPVVDKCENINCGAHGTCSDGMCVCSDDYYGPRCETAPLNCGAHGTWNPATKACDCSDGYTGTTCQTAPVVDKCAGITCQGGGNCNPDTGMCACEPLQGWVQDGQNCKPATCAGNYKDTCPAGYEPTEPCLSGGKTFYQCENCASGYVKLGGTCVLKIDCHNGTQTGDGICLCNTGWDATSNCAECDSTHVLINGRCVAKLNCAHGTQYDENTCSCENKWTGALCDTCPLTGDHITNCACDDGYTQDGNACVSSTSASCTTSQYWDGSTCQACPAHSTSAGGNAQICYCNDGYTNLGKTNTTCFAQLDCNGHGYQTGDGTCKCTDGWSGNLCTIEPACSENQYWDGSTCQACQNGGTSSGGTTCACLGNWSGAGCGTCSLTGNNVNAETCSCADGYRVDGNACVANSGGTTGSISVSGLSGLKVLGQDTAMTSKTYTQKTDLIVSAQSLPYYQNDEENPYIPKLSGELSEDQYEFVWLIKHFNLDINDEDPGIGTTYYTYDSAPLLYLGSSGTQGASLTLENTATLKVTDYVIDSTHLIDTVGMVGIGVHMVNSGNLGEKTDGTIDGLDMDIISAGADITLLNSGIADGINCYGYSGNIKCTNDTTGQINSMTIMGNVNAYNKGSILESALLDGNGTLTNTGKISGSISVGRGTVINEAKGVINGDYDEYDKTYDNAFMIFGPTTIINHGTINGNIILMTYLKNIYQGQIKEGNTRASLTFINDGVFNGERVEWGKNYWDSIYSLSTSNTSTKVLNLDDMGGLFVMRNNGVINAKAIKGTMIADLDTSGFQDQYISSNAVLGENAGIHMISQSAMFDATLVSTTKNTHDIVMTRRGFDTLTGNGSLASFLEKNYTAGRNEGFFNTLKSLGTVSEFNGALRSMTGLDNLTRFAHEDLTALRDMNLTMNAAMFANDDKPLFQTQGSLTAFSFKNDRASGGQYALANRRISPSVKVGYALSMTRLNTGKDTTDTRNSTVFQVATPVSLTHGRVRAIMTPTIGFARGHYNRSGFNGTTYKGTLEKRFAGVMNEARVPMTVAGWEVSPTMELNAVAYNQRGNEEDKAFSLTIPSDNRMSVEGGMGLHVARTYTWGRQARLNLTAGIMGYREFANPYNIKMGMSGMDGTFDLYDDRVSAYRGVANLGLDFTAGEWQVFGTLRHYMERETHTDMTAGLKYRF